jgi:hypothetical protein
MHDDVTAATAAPAATTVLGEARTYDELIALFRKRCDEFGTAMERIDDIAGVAKGYTAKLLAHKPVRYFGRVSLGALLGSLGLALMVIEDATALAKVKRRLVPSVYAGSRMLAQKRRKRFSLFRGNPDLARRIRQLQILKQTPHQRRQIAAHAAAVRWAGRPGRAQDPSIAG